MSVTKLFVFAVLVAVCCATVLNEERVYRDTYGCNRNRPCPTGFRCIPPDEFVDRGFCVKARPGLQVSKSSDDRKPRSDSNGKFESECAIGICRPPFDY